MTLLYDFKVREMLNHQIIWGSLCMPLRSPWGELITVPTEVNNLLQSLLLNHLPALLRSGDFTIVYLSNGRPWVYSQPTILMRGEGTVRRADFCQKTDESLTYLYKHLADHRYHHIGDRICLWACAVADFNLIWELRMSDHIFTALYAYKYDQCRV